MIYDEAAINAQIDLLINDNESGDITPADVRAVLKSITGSAQLRQIAGPGASLRLDGSDGEFEFTAAATVTVQQFWAVSAGGRPLRSATLNGVALDLAATSHTVPITLPANVDKVLELFVSDGTATASSALTVRFRHRRRVFVLAADLFALGDAALSTQLSAQPGEPATSRQLDVTLSGAAQFFYFCFPASFGTPIFKANGLLTSAWEAHPFTFTNALGYAAAFVLYRFQARQNGSAIISIS